MSQRKTESSLKFILHNSRKSPSTVNAPSFKTFYLVAQSNLIHRQLCVQFHLAKFILQVDVLR